mgnify:CR=1 FL=1
MTIELSDEARKWLAESGYDLRFGARPLGRIIQEHIKNALAEELLFGRLAKGGVVRVTLVDGKPAFEYPEIIPQLPPPGRKGKPKQLEPAR